MIFLSVRFVSYEAEYRLKADMCRRKVGQR